MKENKRAILDLLFFYTFCLHIGSSFCWKSTVDVYLNINLDGDSDAMVLNWGQDIP